MNCQDHLYRNADPTEVTRRWFFQECAVGLGALALGHLLGEVASAAPAAQPAGRPLAPKQPHYAPRAKNVIFLFMAGAPSPLEPCGLTTAVGQVDSTLTRGRAVKCDRSPGI